MTVIMYVLFFSGQMLQDHIWLPMIVFNLDTDPNFECSHSMKVITAIIKIDEVMTTPLTY